MVATRLFMPILGLLLLAPPSAHAQQVIRHADPSAPLEARWAWGAREARQQGGAWVAYSIQRRTGEHRYISHGSGWEGRRSLYELIHGERPEGAATSEEDLTEAARRALQRRRGAERLVERDLAILFRIEHDGDRIAEVNVNNLEQPFDLDGRPLVWLGEAADGPSIDLLQELYGRAEREDLKEDVVTAVGVHDEADRVVPFLQRVLGSRDDDDVRKTAAFWLGQTTDPGALRSLVTAAHDDRSGDVREHAVFSLSQMELPEATDELIKLAREAGETEVRKQAIFWLGQQASEKAAAALGDAAFAPGETDVQKQAVFAISQLPEEKGIPMLIEVIRTHPNPEVRKQAIFWLGQSGDPRAVDILVELVRGQ